MIEKQYLPKLIAWEVTRTCNLNCKHCRANAYNYKYENEFTKEECFKLIDNISSFSNSIIILTGGEPMMRKDIFDISEYGTKKGLKMVIAPCGMFVNEENATKMLNAGIKRISLSIDGADKESHDSFRRVDGAFDIVLKAAENAKKVGLEFQINTTVTKHNYKEIDKIYELAIKLGAVSFHPFLLVPTGRAKNLKEQEISPEEYEKILIWIYENRENSHLRLKPTCAPHYYRIFHQMEKKKNKKVLSETHGLDALTKGCMGGQSFAFISHIGKVQICGFLDVECGDIRKENYDFKKIWETSPVFIEMRNIDEYHGRCGYCEYRKVCGGCRARAYAITGDYLDEEPYCIYQPKIKNSKQKYL